LHCCSGFNESPVARDELIGYQDPSGAVRDSQVGLEVRRDLDGLRVGMILTNGYAPDIRVEKEALALSEAGAKVVIFAWDRTGDRKPREEIAPNCEVRRLVVRSKDGLGARQLPRFARYWSDVVRAINRETWDVLHAHDLDGMVPTLFCRPPRIGCVYDAHELFPLMVGERLGACSQGAAWGMERWFVRRARLIITDGEPRARIYRNALRAKRVIVVENTVDLARFGASRTNRASLRASLTIPENAWVIGVFTSLSSAKDLGTLWQALEQWPDTWVLIAGGGRDSGRVQDLARNHSRVRYLGYVPNVATWYSAVDAVYYALNPESRNSRLGFPNNVATAAASGVPIVVADVGECGRLVRRFRLGPVFVSGRVQELLSAMNLLRDPSVYRQYVDNIAKAQERFSWDRSRQRLVDGYRDLASGRS